MARGNRLRGLVAGGAIALGSASAVLTAQSVPRRPRLPGGADTNSARAYYQFGVDRLGHRSHDAIAGFFWASRIEPASADALYGLRAALLLTDNSRLRAYMEGDSRVMAEPEVIRIDSLQWRAVMLDPFFFRGLGAELWLSYLEQRLAQDPSLRAGNLTTTEIRRAIIVTANRDFPEAAGWFAYADGNYRSALNYWTDALRREPPSFGLHADRARAFWMMGAFDSAHAEMDAALHAARADDAEHMHTAYDSKEEWEYSLGRLNEQLGDVAAAREAYQRALIENLGYFMAHVRLGMLAVRTGDTVGAITELVRAVAVKEDDYLPQLFLGDVLAMAGRYDSAAVHLRRAVELEPFVATPNRLLGQVLELSGDAPHAAVAYRRFLALARRDEPHLAAVRERLDALAGAAGAPRP